MRAYRFPKHGGLAPYSATACDVAAIDLAMETICPPFQKFVHSKMKASAERLRCSASPTQHCNFVDAYALLIMCAAFSGQHR